MKKLITNNKLTQLLKLTTLKTQKEFYHFLQGLHASKKVQLKLFEYVIEAAPTFEDEEYLQIDKAYQSVFNKPLSENKDRKNLLNAFSDLTKWLEDFLLLKKLEVKSFERTYLLQSIYQELGLSENYANPLQKAYEKMLAIPDNQNSLALFQLNELIYFQEEKEQTQISYQHLENGLRHLDRFYILKKLKYSSELASRQSVLNEPIELEISKNKLLSLPEHLLAATPLNKIYWLHYKLLTVKEISIQETVFQTLKDLIFNFTIEDKILHHTSLIYAANYAAKRFAQGDDQYIGEALSLYEYGLTKDILILNNIFPLAPFLSLVNIYCRKKEFDNARNFIESHKQSLLTPYRQDGYHLGRARIYVGQKKYAKAYKFLNRIQFRHLQFKIQAALLTVICLIENKDKKEFKKFTQKLSKMVSSRSKLPKILLVQIQHFIALTQHLFEEDISKNVLKEKVNSSAGLPHKIWFLEKLETQK